jgi:hypothetical protein
MADTPPGCVFCKGVSTLDAIALPFDRLRVNGRLYHFMPIVLPHDLEIRDLPLVRLHF